MTGLVLATISHNDSATTYRTVRSAVAHLAQARPLTTSPRQHLDADPSDDSNCANGGNGGSGGWFFSPGKRGQDSHNGQCGESGENGNNHNLLIVISLIAPLVLRVVSDFTVCG
jgi:hypothetical protein